MHPLDGPRAKTERATSQLRALNDEMRRCFELTPYLVVMAEFDGQAGHYNLRVHGGPVDFPYAWGVLIGEIAHNLRSALDGLAWQLALLNTADPFARTQFPIFSIGHTAEANRPHFWETNDGPRMIRSIENRFLETIESVQPYKRGNGGRRNPLFLLSELNNTDKHRVITVVATTIGGMEITGLSGGSTIKHGVSLRQNAKVGHILPLPQGGVPVLAGFTNGQLQIQIQHEVQVDINLTPGVLFGDGCKAVKRLPVIRCLDQMTTEVARVIDWFAAEF